MKIFFFPLMIKSKNPKILGLVLVVLAIGLYSYLSKGNKSIENKAANSTTIVSPTASQSAASTYSKREKSVKENGQSGDNIRSLTDENTVVPYVKEHHRLPPCYITKREARQNGWNPSEGNLCDVLPGRAIGGDYFSNRERRLPQNNRYYEADVNYDCGHRDADRLIFTKDGDVWITYDHYRTFTKK